MDVWYAKLKWSSACGGRFPWSHGDHYKRTPLYREALLRTNMQCWNTELTNVRYANVEYYAHSLWFPKWVVLFPCRRVFGHKRSNVWQRFLSLFQDELPRVQRRQLPGASQQLSAEIFPSGTSIFSSARSEKGNRSDILERLTLRSRLFWSMIAA